MSSAFIFLSLELFPKGCVVIFDKSMRAKWQWHAGVRVAIRCAVLRLAALHQDGEDDGRVGRVRGARPSDDGAQRDGHADGEQGLDGTTRRHLHR